MMTPAHSWIGPPPLAYPISPVPGVNNHQPWAPSPTGSNARPSVSSQTSSLESAASSHEELQNTLQSVARALQLGNKLVQRAQPLLEMSPEARNMAILLLALQTCITPKPTPNPVVVPAQLPAEPTATQTPTDQQFSSAFRTWVRETSCPVLLAEDLQSYGSRASRRLRVADTPFPQVQAELNRQDEAFRAAHLPPNIAQGDALERLLCDTVKSKKAALAILIQVGLTGAGPPNPLPRLYKLIADVYAAFHPDFRRQADRQIPLDKRSSAYGVAYSQLIFNLDQATWTGEKTVNDVEEAA
ncbi:hypothetical protein PTTG_27450 [Puccinia triticina 1-1 BBBD Race 1]|uniref:Uncharacterized protein n=1 Tax=Puccinia triticina (isolate 1-1 / race 1 (BBBD)) TaxID=630390 RepID=A0A180GKL2_PUCT1|nr:hypothetical protein PTTG_27450 [Puccinia triticina 1-1 BBBD Race 1]